jgi:hypothetical protein
MSWDAPLSDPVVIESGGSKTITLRTLRDVGDHLVKVYSSRRGGVIEGLLEALLKASKDPSPVNIARATDATESFFSFESLLVGPLKIRISAEAGLYQRLAAMMAPAMASAKKPAPRRQK